MSATIIQFAIGPMQNFSYLLGDPATKRAALIDPGWEAKGLLDKAHAAGFIVDSVLLTHCHFDHIGALAELHALNPIEIFVRSEEAHTIDGIGAPIHLTSDDQPITVGKLSVRALHTPGHSPGGQCFLVDSACFTGDTLFIEGCGRVDLTGSNPEQMWYSLQKLKALPANTVVYPGHDYGSTPTSTIGELCVHNRYLHAASQEEFFRHRL